MNFTHKLFNQYYAIMLPTLLTLLMMVSACGGGGGGSSPAPTAVAPPPPPVVQTDTGNTPNYQPAAALLSSAAGDSTELYVEPDFEFDTAKVITLDLLAKDEFGQPLSKTLLKVSAIPNEVEDIVDPAVQQGSIVFISATDSNGAIYQQIEVAQTVNKLLLEVQTVGIENAVIVTLDDSNRVIYQFQ